MGEVHQASCDSYRFDRFTLDLRRGVLLDADGGEIPLRPKSFALLHLMVENAERLLDRDTIMAALWPGLFVTDDSLSQCVKDVRRALGEDGQLLRTVPKRGYILTAPVIRAGPEPSGWAAGQPAPGPTPTSAAIAGEAASAPPVPGASPVRTRTRLPLVMPMLALVAVALLSAGALWTAGTLPQIGGAERSGGEARPVPGAAVPFEAGLAASPRFRAERLTADAWQLSAPGRGNADIQVSRDMLERAVVIDPSYPRGWAYLAMTLAVMANEGLSTNAAEDALAAERAAARALALAPEDPNGHAARGAVLEFQHDRLEEALAAYQRSVALDPNQHRSRGKVGRLLILLGRAEEAELPLRTSLEATSSSSSSWWKIWRFHLGLVHLLLARDGHGVPDFREALCSPASLGCDLRTFHLAAALALEGKPDEARRLVSEVRQRRPDLTVEAMRQLAGPSRNPTYLGQRERLLSGLARAGLPDR